MANMEAQIDFGEDYDIDESMTVEGLMDLS